MTVYTYNDVARRFKRLKFGIAICLLCANVLFIEAQSMQPLPQKSEADQFSSETINKSRLQAFEQRAIQKVRDFNDYLVLIADDGYDIELRKFALNSALSLFSSPASSVFLVHVSSKKKMTIEGFLTEQLNEKRVFHIQNIKPRQAFVKLGNSYQGQLAFEYREGKKAKQKAAIEIVILKIEKQFGSETRWIWEVKLGNITTLP